jgi:Flp pilus assembly protein CpaB
MRRSPRALAAWLAALAVALVTARVVATDLATLHRRAATLGPHVDVVFAARDVPLGATFARADVRTRSMYASSAPPGALHDARAVVGRVATVAVLRGTAVVARAVAPARRSGLAAVVPNGSRVVRVHTDDGLVPRPGDVVDVLVSLDPSLVGPRAAATPPRRSCTPHWWWASTVRVRQRAAAVSRVAAGRALPSSSPSGRLTQSRSRRPTVR